MVQTDPPPTVARSPRGDEAGRALVERAQAGDEAARRSLVVQTQRPVFAVVSRVLGPRASAAEVEDVAQETYLKVFRALERFDPDGPARISTWIVTIASRTALDVARRRKPDAVDLDALATGPVPSALISEQLADAPSDRRAVGLAVARAVDALAPPYRAAFVLRAYHERSYAEIAEALDIDIGTVKSRLARAKSTLSRALAEVRDVH